MPGIKRESRESDEQILSFLHMRHTLGMDFSEIGRAHGVTKNTAIGAVNRVDNASNAVLCWCRKPENKDGGMPAEWWAFDKDNTKSKRRTKK